MVNFYCDLVISLVGHLVALPARHGVHGGLVVAVGLQVVHAGLLL